MTPAHPVSSRPLGVVRALAALVALAALILTGACAEPSVAEERTGYEATLNNYAIREVPLAPEPAMDAEGQMDEDGEMTDEAPAEGDGEEGEEMEGMEPAPVDVRQDLILDIMMERTRRSADLAGVTVDVTHADENEAEKAVYRVWVDTSDVRSLPLQKDAVVEDIDFAEGDRFHVEIRHPIAEGERGEYREFSDAGGEG